MLGSLFLELHGSINSSTVDSNIASIAPCIAAAAATLLRNGEQNIIIATSAPVYTTPLAAAYGLSDLLKGWVLPLNSALNTTVSSLAAAFPSASVSLWDASAVVMKVYEEGARYGVTEVQNPCLVTEVSPSDPLGLTHHKLISRCPDPSKLAFWWVVTCRCHIAKACKFNLFRWARNAFLGLLQSSSPTTAHPSAVALICESTPSREVHFHTPNPRLSG